MERSWEVLTGLFSVFFNVLVISFDESVLQSLVDIEVPPFFDLFGNFLATSRCFQLVESLFLLFSVFDDSFNVVHIWRFVKDDLMEEIS